MEVVIAAVWILLVQRSVSRKELFVQSRLFSPENRRDWTKKEKSSFRESALKVVSPPHPAVTIQKKENSIAQESFANRSIHF